MKQELRNELELQKNVNQNRVGESAVVTDASAIQGSEQNDARVEEKNNNLLWDVLLGHCGHHVSIACYGDSDAPANVALECEDCGCIIVDAGIYTLAGRSDV